MLKTIFAYALLLCGVNAICAQEREAPIETQYLMLRKALAFERGLLARTDKEIVVGVLYQSRHPSSLAFLVKLREAIKKVDVERFTTRPLRFVEIELHENFDFARDSTKQRFEVFYLGPVHTWEVKALTEISRARKILTFTGVPAQVEAGLTLGVIISENRPLLLINLPAARAEGAEFDAQLLRLARILE